MGTGRADKTAQGDDDVAMLGSATITCPCPVGLDPESQRWVERLRPGHPRSEPTVRRLHQLLRRVAIHELSRRRGQLPGLGGPEFDDLAHQAADDALVSLLGRLDEFEGRSRFTTWAYSFAVYEVSAKVARHAWQRQAPADDADACDRLPDLRATRPEDRLEQHDQLRALRSAIVTLTERQRTVFVAVALNDVPIDVVALQLGSNRNAVYKNLFDARRGLRLRLAAPGHLGVGVSTAPPGT
jgi:RNA polymerase sigma-70 factor (ECF subfamily)